MFDQVPLALALRKQLGTPGLSQKAGVHKSVTSRAKNTRRGLSIDASESMGEVLGVDPTALYISSNVVAKTAQAEAGEITPGSALASLSRVASKLEDMHRNGELTASPELVEAIGFLDGAIQELSKEAGDQVRKYAAPEEETYADGLRAENRDPAGRKVTKAQAQRSYDEEGAIPLAPWHRQDAPLMEDFEEMGGEQYDDFEAEGRTEQGIRIFIPKKTTSARKSREEETASARRFEDDELEDFEEAGLEGESEIYGDVDDGRDANGIRIRPLNESR